MGAVLPSSAVGPEVIFLLLEENFQQRVLRLIAFSLKKPFDWSKKNKFLMLPSMLLTPFVHPLVYTVSAFLLRFQGKPMSASIAQPAASH